MNCPGCGNEMVYREQNFFFTVRGIEVTLAGNGGHVCDFCGKVIFSTEVEEKIDRLIEEKITQFPDSPPSLYVCNFESKK